MCLKNFHIHRKDNDAHVGTVYGATDSLIAESAFRSRYPYYTFVALFHMNEDPEKHGVYASQVEDDIDPYVKSWV